MDGRPECDNGRRMHSRWSSDGPGDDHFHGRGRGRFHRGGGRGGDRFHPYRGPQDHPTGDGGPGRFGHGGRGFYGNSPDYADGNKPAKLYIGSVPPTATEEDIHHLFEDYGHVIEAVLVRDKITGQQKGFGFVKYATHEEADRAIAALHNQYTLPGALAALQVKYAGEREHHGQGEAKLYVGAMNKGATEHEIAEIFEPYGQLLDVYILKDDFKQSKGSGFVRFSNKEMAAAAINGLHGNYVMRGCDQPLIVRFADSTRSRLDQRVGPAFRGPGFGHRSGTSMNRPPSNFDQSMSGRPPNDWGSVDVQPNGPSLITRTNGFDHSTSTKFGAPETSLAAGTMRDTVHPIPQQGFSMASVNPNAGQQMPQMQKPFIAPQQLPPSQQHNSQQILASYPQEQASQVPVQHQGQTVPPQQFPGPGQMSASQPFIEQNVRVPGTQMQSSVQQQVVPAKINHQQLPGVPQQLLQRPAQPMPTKFSRVPIPEHSGLRSRLQASEKAFSILQQQVQSMQQSGMNQQQLPQDPHQKTSSTPVDTQAVVMSSAAIATYFVPASSTCGVPSIGDWSEHNSPEGFKYYFNCVTRESKWEKPEEFLLYDQHQQRLQSQAQTTLHSQAQPNQQVSQTQPTQLQHPGSVVQVSGVTGHQGIQHSMQGQRVQPAADFSYLNKPAGLNNP